MKLITTYEERKIFLDSIINDAVSSLPSPLTGIGTPPALSLNTTQSLSLNTGTNTNVTNVNSAGGRGVKTYGTLGPNGNTLDLSSKALTIDGINTLVANSGTDSIIRQRIVQIAASYVGNQEAQNPPKNPGWLDPDYESKFKQLAQPWSYKQPWCAYFCQLVWKEAYTVGNKLVPSVDNLQFAPFYKDQWKNTFKNGKVIGGGVSSCKSNFQKLSRFITLNQATSGQILPEPGDIAVYSYSHVDIVIQPFTQNGKLIGYSAIGGNTSSSDPRNGGETKYYPKKPDWKKAVGFCRVITPFS
jgi:hypothetical protein